VRARRALGALRTVPKVPTRSGIAIFAKLQNAKLWTRITLFVAFWDVSHIKNALSYLMEGEQ